MLVYATKKKVLKNSTPLYEENFSRLIGFLPDLDAVDKIAAIDKDGYAELTLEVIERCKYMRIIRLSLSPLGNIKLLSQSNIVVRLYMDARVAEVISFQGHRRLKPYYVYPNEKMYLPDEKWQHNVLLREMLRFCEARCFYFPIMSA